MNAASRSARALAVCAVGALALGSCSPRRFVAARLGSALAAGGAGWASDDDPRLVGEALPFALKTYESLLAETPEHVGLRLAACRGFASYAAGWVEPEAERLETADFAASQEERRRALRLHLRARDHCLRAWETELPGFGAVLRRDPEPALARVRREQIERLYWTAAAWGSAVSLGLDRPELVAELPLVRALFARASALDPDYDRGALAEAMVALESVSELLGGSPDRARRQFERAVALSRGERASPYVTYARGVLVAQQDRKGFREMLEKALAVDLEASPADRLANRLAQERAARLLARADELFFVEE